MKKKYSGHFLANFQLLYLSILTVFDILLVVVGSIAKSPVWMVVIFIVLLVVLWGLYVAQVSTDRVRIYLDTVVAALSLMIYGAHQDSLTDMPLVLCLLIIVLSCLEDIYLLYLISFTYPIMVLYHILFTHYISLQTNWIILSRVVLGLFCVGMAILISRYFMKNRKTDDTERETLQSALFRTQQGNHNFLANVSHELRTPINAINGISEIMLKEDLEPETRSQIENIHTAGHRIYEQVSSILDYAEISMGEMVVNEKEYSIKALADTCLQELKKKTAEKCLEVISDYSDDLPGLLLGDEYKIRKVLTVLLDNAGKFTSWGSVRLKVDCRKEDYGVNLNLDVYDTGCGMSASELHKLLEGTFQADATSTRRKGGLGISFAIAHYLVREMNGFIFAESEPNRGTHIHVTIPQKLVPGAEQLTISEFGDWDLFYDPSVRVLVVDDEKMNLTVMKGILKRFGFTIRAVESGSEALALCQLEDFDLIFMDYMMPEMDGETTMKKIRGLRDGFYDKVPIVALTADAASGSRSKFLFMGFDEFIQKPVEIAELDHYLKKELGGEKHE